MPPVLRPLCPTDAPAAAALIRAAFAAQPVVLDPPASALRVTADGLVAHLARAGGAVAESGGRAVGVVLWEADNGALQVSRLAVDPQVRRRGIARALLAAAEAEAQQCGLSRLRLGTRLALTGNRRLFVDCGFIEIALHAHPGYPEPTWVEMEKRLNQAGNAASPMHHQRNG
jgi:ribosomal protein S18 acetylase RimI-like enzyme